MRRLLIAAVVAIAVAAAASPTAYAAWISKKEARGYAVKSVKRLYRDIDWATGYWVEHSPRCERIAGSVVECDYELYDDLEDITCTDAVQIIATARSWRARYPYEADCY